LSCAFSAPITLPPVTQRAVHSFFVHFALGCLDLRFQRVSIFVTIQIVDLTTITMQIDAYNFPKIFAESLRVTKCLYI